MRIRSGFLPAIFIAAAAAAPLVLAAPPSTQPAAASPDLPIPPPLPTAPATQPDVAPATEPVAPPPPPLLPATQPIPATQPVASTMSRAVEPERPITRPSGSNESHLRDVLVEANLEQTYIAPGLGAREYTIGQERIENLPGGENAPFQQALLRAPGVVEDSFGQVHVRGEHANLTYRVNGVLLPVSIGALGGFGQELDTRIVQSVTLIDGTLPAQFGFHTAGIVDVTTKSGATLENNQLSLYGGSYDTFQPSLQLGGTRGRLDYFLVASYKYSGLGIENPTSSDFPLHDYTNQERLFGYVGYRIDDTSRLTLMLNASYATFQIPDVAGVPPGFSLAGHPTFNSATLNENQTEEDNYEVLSYQKILDRGAFQVSLFSRYGQVHFSPDPIGDLVLQGVSGRITNGFLTNGMQFDASYKLSDDHTLRFGFLGDYTNESVDTNTAVFPLDATGAQASDTPFSISGNRGNWGAEYGFYLQDEWKLTDVVTLNYGARYDRFDSSFDNEDQISPRANLVWKVDRLTTAHVGYARYFVPPPVQYVWPQTVAQFANTSNTPENFLDNKLRAERSNDYDIGISRQMTKSWEVSVDGFYKGAKPLLDSGQFGNAVILSPFNYRVGKVYGAEFSSTYKQGGLSLFGNFAWVSATGEDITSSQYLIGNDDLAFAKNHFIHLDHESQYTVSAGVSYAWKGNRVYADILYGSGLRSGPANLSSEPAYYPVNVGFEHIYRPVNWGVKDVRLRFDVVNVFDQVYQHRDGSGIGVAAPQFGARRGFFAGLTFDF